ncbi:type I restriction endonuclease subunit R [Vibrio parahaemolyticus]|uniref:type I restriction endonuclease subunit R n=1 Tax=Vibrio parahaemolyticus TaxID=670 RepID=UPI0007DC20C3|nr:DEAD/DEAH box helicase family protein [Vibrio parahaemolyticus]EGR2360402.1 type I restriction endonuclease subunit R [Vibrio parahaemolyticus]EGU6977979.1 type I restriction endonuclease subunit R [Vibrio parahaemolyticus]EIO2937950.1 type I restriction endonuclease subunit R [Vibrio parahaemolyticus]MBE3849228.1 type I restriction endonuclease subunit R [Vibrio parahaemolyticus]MCQ9044179.1 type I restriction endonuclease subunit R [Vibrio parahaemolyticus]
MKDTTQERVFQDDIISQMVANGWVQGTGEGYNRESALYEADVLTFIKDTQPKEWEKFCKVFPTDSERHFIDALVTQLKKADENATDRASRTFGTLGVLRHGLKIRNARFELCQFKPEHNLNPETLARYQHNICRIVPELVYSPYATKEQELETGKKAKKWRIDLVLFVNGLPVSTLELKSEFKQAVENAIAQYKLTRLPKDPATKKPEPLLSFKRGALVHFAVSQYEVHMATKLAGEETFFLPFNKGTHDGGKGNDIPDDENRYATDYLWNEVLTPDNLLNIIGRFIHLQIEEKEDWEGRKTKKEALIFPRYHQWDVVTKLVNAAIVEGTGNKYLIQHSAGSGKSNSIAWTAHQLSTLHDANGNKQFDSVIVVTDRTVLDDQLQDTIYQFEHADGVVGRINRKEGDGSKSEKLATALETSQPIIIVTIQTFPHVLKAIENSTSLKERRYAIIADEAHSSQTGATARQLKEVLMTDEADDDTELSSEDILDATVAARRGSANLSYYAFTATPKPKTLELFGRRPDPEQPASKRNLPVAYHIYSMRQAIEEGFILDVLRNYTNYKVIYQLKQKLEAEDKEVDAGKAKLKLNNWVRLHDHNISQKVKVIVEHFKKNVMGLLGGQAKAMVVTSSRKEAVRYKLAFDKYVSEHGYAGIRAMVAFSGEVEFNAADPDSTAFMDQKFTEHNMNPELNKREMRVAFDSDDYQVMLVANKYQTGFDQPKLCAMYVDKKLAGVECVQTLSRLNRTYPGKAECGTFVLDFYNDPQDILDAFQPYYQVAELEDVTDPDKIFDLSEKLRASGIFLWSEVDQFVDAFFTKNKSNAAISNIFKPAIDRWRKRYTSAVEAYIHAKNVFERTKKTGDAVLIANAENTFKECKQEKDRLEIFKKDLGSFVRFYEFMSQIVDYDDKELEKLSLYARHLRPMLREKVIEEDELDLGNVVMSHYRLSKIRQQDIQLQENTPEYKLHPSNDVGTAKPKDKKEEFLSHIIERLNEVFVTDNLTDKDMINYAFTVRDKLTENETVMSQIANNTREQAMLGDFPRAIDDAILNSNEAHQEQMMQLLSDPNKTKQFARVIFDMLSGVK